MKQIYTVFDSAAEAYLDPFVAPSRGAALRSFGDAANRDGHPFNDHPEDYILYHIGTFDEDTGQVLSAPHANCGKAVEYVRRPHLSPEGS